MLLSKVAWCCLLHRCFRLCVVPLLSRRWRTSPVLLSLLLVTVIGSFWPVLPLSLGTSCTLLQRLAASQHELIPMALDLQFTACTPCLSTKAMQVRQACCVF